MRRWAADTKRRVPGMSLPRFVFVWVICRGLVYIYFRVIYRIRAEGAGRVPRTGPVIYVANHQSHYDPPAIGCVLIDRPPAFLARSTLFRFRPFGAMIRFFNAIPLNRESRGTGAFRAVLAELEAGRSILVFPEGTRCRDGRIGPFKPGFLLLVRRSAAAVVPIAIEGAFDIWPCTAERPRLTGRIRVRIGEAISAAQCRAMGNETLITRVKDAIQVERRALRAKLRAETNGRFPPPGAADDDDVR
jgi:1-acyl-sn-glycerol-3-phosphate acyltransferase